MHRRTKMVAIPPKVRQAVEERDGHKCIFCGSPNASGNAHFINRSQGGLGVERNLICACSIHHREMDNGLNTQYYREFAREYLKSKYPDWNEDDLVYNKWKGFKYD